MNKFYIREDEETTMTEQQRLNSDLDDAANFGRGVKFALLFAFLIAVAVWSATTDAQTAGSGTLTIATEPAPSLPGEVITRLTWSTTPAGASCVATGSWTGAKVASGTETLPPARPPQNYGLRCTWASDSTATLSWIAPATFVPEDHDNNPATPPVAAPLPKCAAATDTGACLAKYRIKRGVSATTLNETRDHNFPNATGATWSALTPGTHWFTVIPVLGNGIEGAAANPVSRVATAGSEWTASVGLRAPEAVTNLAVQ